MSEIVIIDNRVDGISTAKAIEYAAAVVRSGKIDEDGSEYCYATQCDNVTISDGSEVVIYASNNNGTVTFVIEREFWE